MQFRVIVSLACVLAQVAAQNYGPLPQRPQFVGASLVQGPPRPVFRQRGTARAIQEPIQQVQHVQPLEQQQLIHRGRRPQITRGRPLYAQQAAAFEQPRNIIDDVPPVQFKPKLALPPQPLPQFQPSQPLPPQPLPPQQIPQQTQPPKLLTPRPVEEETNEASSEEQTPIPVTTPITTTAFTAPVRPAFPQPAQPILQPSPLPISYPPRPQFVQPAVVRPPPQPVQPIGFPEAASLPARQLIRTQVRPALEPSQVPISRPIQQQVLKPKEDPIPEVPQYFRQPVVRPQKKQEPVARQQVIEPDQLRVREPVRQIYRQQPQQQTIRQQQQEFVQRPVQREPHVKASSVQREKKPVVQTIRKFHEEHEDGSITWGYENDDGSFKEETIGVDCVTRGKYGYIDPDGVKREYTYQTGIPCDRQQQEAEEAASQPEGFVDYTNNKYVFPNGDEIDLEAMVKNRARKPVQQRYRN